MDELKPLPFIHDVLARLADLQADTAAIEVTIGGMTAYNTVDHNVIFVRQAPGRVVSAIVAEYPFVTVGPEGLRINVHRHGSESED